MPIALKVKDVMDKKVYSVEHGLPVLDAVKMMVKNDVWSLLVNHRGLPEGVVTERDVLRRCLGKGLSLAKTPVGSIASSPLVTIGPDASVREAMDLMTSKGIRRLFIVDDGKIVGRVTQTQLFRSTLDVMETLSSLSNTL